ncbi:disease resistance protein RUN1-like [Cryptomeria japonica]|uniref:disease resistance protein RUN1-like n=1 Tax=Cryptomeria japonica TaxID=3369 RepID=UPI0027DA9D8B|nr:disease resistance protein RUN1-like [Cryptomeria japonica]
MASTSSSHQKNVFSGIEPPHERRKVEQSSRLFDVFINHRGPDVKQTLATQLYKSLKRVGVGAFLDSVERELGISFTSTIETAIRSATVHIAIFSKGYVHSPWCLAKLVLMLQTNAKIIPLFYQVEPWELRYVKKGVYKDAFVNYEEKGRHLDKIKEWKESLQQVSYTAGYEFQNSGSIDCKEIVSAVEKELQRTKHLAEIPNLQSKLLTNLFCKDERFGSPKEGISCLRDRLERSSSSSFLIVLDDIDHVEQLDALIDIDILNKYGNHLVVITTCDVGVLVTAGIEIGYHLKGLDRQDGKELFCWHAFRQSHPCSGYEDLIETFVNMCGGLPLSLQVLGRHVSGKDQQYWREELKKVSKTLPGDVKKRLKISFDSLDYEQQQIFMDVACFFIDRSKTMAMTIWEWSGLCSHHALETLKGKCLLEEVEIRHRSIMDWKWIYRGDRSVFRMHDHLRDLGREMANELSHPCRVWYPQHVKSLPQLVFNSDINPSIPSWVPLQNLQCLRISGGCFQRLWQSDMQAPFHLKELHIAGTFLEEFPDLSGKSDNMEMVVLHAKQFQMDIWSLLGSLGMNLRSLKVMEQELTGYLPSTDTAEETQSLVISDFKLPHEGEVALNSDGWSKRAMSGVENLEIKCRYLVTKILITGNCCQCLQSLKICTMENLIEADLEKIKTLYFLEITNCKFFKRLSLIPDLPKLIEFKIDKCAILENNITLPAALIRLSVRSCRDLQRVTGDLTMLSLLITENCPVLEELPSLYRVSCLKQIFIESCEKLQGVSGIEELNALQWMRLCYCSNAVIQDRIHKLKCSKAVYIRSVAAQCRIDLLEEKRKTEFAGKNTEHKNRVLINQKKKYNDHNAYEHTPFDVFRSTLCGCNCKITPTELEELEVNANTPLKSN